ncbi:MAG: hypothetical protein KAU21_15510 [Gammaproteobacteria bacterium]|nr:hypothetical protein [Gammaproteobacteria bacterium]
MKKTLIILMLMFSVIGNIAGTEYTYEQKYLRGVASQICSSYNKSKTIPEDAKRFISNAMRSLNKG